MHKALGGSLGRGRGRSHAEAERIIEETGKEGTVAVDAIHKAGIVSDIGQGFKAL